MQNYDFQLSVDTGRFRADEAGLDEIVQAHQEISARTAAIATLQEEIHSLLRRVDVLRKDVRQHQDRIAACKAVLSVVRSLPNEVLVAIFQWCLDLGWNRAPIVLSLVNTAWRNAAQSPVLWAYISVDCDSNDPVRKTNFWLSRAQRTPLHVNLTSVGDETQSSVVLRLLLQHIARWRTFTLSTRSIAIANAILLECVGPAPELREVRLELQEGEPVVPTNINDGTLYAIRHAFGDCPRLDRFHISCSWMATLVGTMPSHVRNLSIDLIHHSFIGPMFTVPDLLNLLKELPFLEHFSLLSPSGLPQEPYTPFVVNLPFLQSLKLCLPLECNVILQYIRTPNLSLLHLRNSCSLEPPHEQTGFSLRQFLLLSSPPLSTLRLYDTDIPENDFIFCFTHLPNLQELCLHESELSDTVLRMLNGPTGLCPRLSRLDFRWCGVLSGRALVDLVHSRNAGASETLGDDGSSPRPIDEVTVINCSFVEEKDVIDISTMAICRLVLQDIGDECRKQSVISLQSAHMNLISQAYMGVVKTPDIDKDFSCVILWIFHLLNVLG